MPGVGLANAGQILELRETHGGLTPELFSSLPLTHSEQLAEAFDFRPGLSTLYLR